MIVIFTCSILNSVAVPGLFIGFCNAWTSVDGAHLCEPGAKHEELLEAVDPADLAPHPHPGQPPLLEGLHVLQRDVVDHAALHPHRARRRGPGNRIIQKP